MKRERYKTRHAILEALAKRWVELSKDWPEGNSNFEIEVSLAVKYIALRSEIEEAKIERELSYLLYKGFIEALPIEEGVYWYSITTSGKVAYDSETFLEEGKKHAFTNFKERITLWIAILSCVLAIFGFIYNLSKEQENRTDIKNMREQLDSIIKKR